MRFARTFMLSMAILYMFQVVREPIDVTREEIEKAMERLNHRLRKTLGFRTLYEVFFSTKVPLTVALGS